MASADVSRLTCVSAGGAAGGREWTHLGETGSGRDCVGAAIGYGGFLRLEMRLAGVWVWATAERVVVDWGGGGGGWHEAQ